MPVSELGPWHLRIIVVGTENKKFGYIIVKYISTRVAGNYSRPILMWRLIKEFMTPFEKEFSIVTVEAKPPWETMPKGP